MVSLERRLEQLEQVRRYRAPRCISILIEANPVDEAAHTAALREILDVVNPQPGDTVVQIRKWTRGPDEVLPRLDGITASLS